MTQSQRQEIERLFDRHAAGVGGYVLARVADPELAEAITARVFGKIVERFDQCRSSPVAWMWSIVRNELAQHFRELHPLRARGVRFGQLGSEVTSTLVDPAPGPTSQADDMEWREALKDALEHLPEDQRRILGMKFFAEMKNTEIAVATGLSVSNVGVILHRSLKHLRSLMNHEADSGTNPPGA